MSKAVSLICPFSLGKKLNKDDTDYPGENCYSISLDECNCNKKVQLKFCTVSSNKTAICIKMKISSHSQIRFFPLYTLH